MLLANEMLRNHPELEDKVMSIAAQMLDPVLEHDFEVEL